MQESLNNAREELKRVNHMIYVSLKYTRTVDVLINIIGVMIDFYDFVMEALLKQAVEKELIDEKPVSPRERGELIKKLFEDEIINDNIDLYFLLRKLSKSNPEREQEYRRHVTMISYIDNQKELVNIDIISEYYAFQKEFLVYVSSMLLQTENN
ncbi:hypothetical protein CMO90_02785 [Candidatus Woesearchaeota archaeon]|jgi:hypothetical protein|nr:hypothetical protein [Candidatus Woesearchaeota archaeon]|tara:strand:+ start:1063 stop:1524 length:462 start_codon:yes stop_codon:yes gene_type:complete